MRIKKVFRSYDLVKQWLKQCQPEGHVKGGGMSFNGECLYSYQTVIARIITNAKGERAVVKNVASFSPTTNNHQSCLNNAGPGYKALLYTMDDTRRASLLKASEPKEIINVCLSEAARLQVKSVNCPVNGKWYLDRASTWKNRAQNAAQFFGVKVPSLGSFVDEHKQASDEQKRVNKEAAKADEDKVKEWINGGEVSRALNRRPARLRLAYTLLSANPNALNDTITETTRVTLVECSHQITWGENCYLVGTLEDLLPALLEAVNSDVGFSAKEGRTTWNGKYKDRIIIKKTEVRRLLASEGYLKGVEA